MFDRMLSSFRPAVPAGEAFNDVLVLVLRLHGSFTAAGEALAEPAGQTLARWVVLDQCRDAPATVSDIGLRRAWPAKACSASPTC